MATKYNQFIDSAMACEPAAAAYGTATAKRANSEYSDIASENEDPLNKLTAEQLRTMPGQYTIAELREEIRKSEDSGTISNEEALARFARWGFVL